MTATNFRTELDRVMSDVEVESFNSDLFVEMTGRNLNQVKFFLGTTAPNGRAVCCIERPRSNGILTSESAISFMNAQN